MIFLQKKPKEIELLPEAEGSAKAQRIKFFLGLAGGVITALLLAIFVIVLVLSSAENNRARRLSGELESKLVTWQKSAEIAGDIGLVKGQVEQLQKISGGNKVYLATLEEIRRHVPAGVTLTSLLLKQPSSLTIQASAANPTSLYQFVEQLKGQKDFVVQVAISSLTKSADKYLLNLSLTIKTL